MHFRYIILIAAILLTTWATSCREEPKKVINLNEVQKAYAEELRRDIMSKYNSLSEVQKLILCFQDYSFLYPEDFEDLVNEDPEKFADRLRNDEKFIALCKKKNLDHRLIPDDFREIISGSDE